jgi:hypothetical protein
MFALILEMEFGSLTRCCTVHVQVMIVNRQLQRISIVPLVPLEDTKLVEFVGIEHFVWKVVYAYVRLGKRRRLPRLRAIAERFGRRPQTLVISVTNSV